MWAFNVVIVVKEHTFPERIAQMQTYADVRLLPNTHRRRDSTVELSRVGVGGVNRIRN